MAFPLRLCRYVREDGTACRSAPMRGEDFCFWHSPAHTEEAEEARRLGGLRRRKERTVAGAYEFQGLGTVPDIRRLLEVASVDTLSLDNSVARNRTLAYLSQQALKCLEIGELEERVQLLEAALRGRDPSPVSEFDLDLEADEDDVPKELNP